MQDDPAPTVRAENTDSIRDRLEIQDVICGVTLCVDQNEYERVRSLFSKDAQMQYGTLFGSRYDSTPASEFLDFVESYMPGFDHTQHLVTNFEFVIEANEARVRSQVRASHWIDSRDWLVASTYHHLLVRESGGWKIREMRAEKLFESGRDLVAEATERMRVRRQS